VFTFQNPVGGQPWTIRADPDREAGDFGFDPLGLKPTNAAELKEMQTKELQNGRLAMIAAAGMIAQELATGSKLLMATVAGKEAESTPPAPFNGEAFAKTLPGITGPLGFFDPLGYCSEEGITEGKIRFYREVELKHGRVGMLAALGFLVGENFHPLFGGDIDVPSYLAFQQTPLQQFWGAVLFAIAIPEIFSVFSFQSPVGGQPWTIRADHEAGDLGFDPLGLKPTNAAELKEMQTKEINNGRLAMIAAAGMIAQELASGNKLMASVTGKEAPRRRARSTRMTATIERSATATSDGCATRDDVRNIAIIAHVDHGKTTLVDSMLAQSKVFREKEKVQERVMDSNDLERERGITILSKNTAVTYGDKKINIVDTPGHADFGGEVERVLNMVDGVLLLVDAIEGPMPQTRFVLKKALELDKKVLVVVNKVDRDGARPDWVVDKTFDLFDALGACDEQCDFPVIFASGFQGIAGEDHADMADNLGPLFDMIVDEVPAPVVNQEAPLQMLVTNLDYDDFKGRIALGRVTAGTLNKAQSVTIGVPDGAARNGRVNEVFVYRDFKRNDVDSVGAGDICAIAGLDDVMIGETLMGVGAEPLPTIAVEEPTVRMTFNVNTSPFAGREGKLVTSRNIKERLDRELERNLALRVEPGDTADTFIVCGRGALHITILVETMRREGFEFTIGPPQVIMKEDEDGTKLEPYEEAVVEVGEEYSGAVVQLLASRRGEMLSLEADEQGRGTQTIKYKVPTRGLLGVRNAMLSATRGTAVLNTVFDGYFPAAGDISMREQGSLVAFETGPVTAYALFSAQERGDMFIRPGDEIYEGQVVGINKNSGDMKVNVARRKAATNVRSNKDATVVLNEPKSLSLDDCVEYISGDELVEVTPESVRILKNPKMDKKLMKQQAFANK
jgi:GTP-binding protein